MPTASLFRNGLNWILAGVVAAVVIPVLTFGAAIPSPWHSKIPVAFAGLVLLLAPRSLFDGVDVSALDKGRLDVVRKVMTEAAPALERLDAAAARIRNPVIRKEGQELTSTARTIFDRIEQIQRMISVQRFLTYYLPAAAEFVEKLWRARAAALARRRTPGAGGSCHRQAQ